MVSAQLRFWPAPQPLVERFGTAFFRALPRAPGVYLMRDEAGVLQYVGKAKDLRARLNAYRTTTHASAKTLRLLARVAAIAWEGCPSDAAARLRENQLIREHRPRFNRVGTWPYGWVIGIACTDAALSLTLEVEALRPRPARPRAAPAPAFAVWEHANGPGTEATVEGEAGTRRFGVFRAGAPWAFQTLLRLLWLNLEPARRPGDLPHRLSQATPPRAFAFTHANAVRWAPPLLEYWAGHAVGVVDQLTRDLAPPATPFEIQQRAAAEACLRDFFARGPARQRALCARFGRSEARLAAAELDDLLALDSDPAGS